MEVNKSQNKKDGLLNEIMEKYGKCEEVNIMEIVAYHLKVVADCLKQFQEKGEEGLTNRSEYQKFQVAKLFVDKTKLMEYTFDPSLKEFKTYKDLTLPPLDAFRMTSDMKETRKIKFLKTIDKGDILHLQVVGEDANEYKFLVINKYNDNERIADYLIYAYMVKAHRVQDLPIPLQMTNFIRAAVFGKLKQEKDTFSKLLVTFNTNIISEKYKNVYLGIVREPSIPCFPENISNHSTFLNYMKVKDIPDDHEDMVKCMSSLGIDPYKTYSFRGSSDGRKSAVPEDKSVIRRRLQNESMNLVKEVENQVIRSKELENQAARATGAENQVVDPKSLLPLLDKALEIWPNNDAAYAVKGQLYKYIFIREHDFDYILKSLENLQKALQINGYNLTATREYLSLLLLSAHLYRDEGDRAKLNEILKIIFKFKDVCDVTDSDICREEPMPV